MSRPFNFFGIRVTLDPHRIYLAEFNNIFVMEKKIHFCHAMFFDAISSQTFFGLSLCPATGFATILFKNQT
jgi:hypothetical protein